MSEHSTKYKKIKLSDSEYSQLMREAINGKYISVTYGIGWVSLDDIPSNHWALKSLAEMRGIEI